MKRKTGRPFHAYINCEPVAFGEILRKFSKASNSLAQVLCYHNQIQTL